MRFGYECYSVAQRRCNASSRASYSSLQDRADAANASATSDKLSSSSGIVIESQFSVALCWLCNRSVVKETTRLAKGREDSLTPLSIRNILLVRGAATAAEDIIAVDWLATLPTL